MGSTTPPIRLPPSARPAILGGMDQERDDYADLNLPPPRWTAERIVVRLLQIVFVALMFALFALLFWFALGR